MKCTNCGNELKEGAKFCAQCGTPVVVEAPVVETPVVEAPVVENTPVVETPVVETPVAPAPAPTPVVTPVAPAPAPVVTPVVPAPAVNTAAVAANQLGFEPNPKLSYKPIGMWGYFGYDILFAIPLIGFIMLLIFACGGTQNANLRNYARSKFCWFIIAAVLIIIGLLIIAATGATMGGYRVRF